MKCHCCGGEEFKRNGKFSNRNRVVQRYLCLTCGGTYSETQPMDGVCLETGKVAMVVQMLCEGIGIRAISRLSGLSRNTVLKVLETAGRHCQQFADEKLRNLNCKTVQADELYAFVYALQRNVPKELQDVHGTFFTFLSSDRDSKLIINSFVGKRTTESAENFLRDLKHRIPNRFQLTTDGWTVYAGYDGAVRNVFGTTIDYATETKYFAKPTGDIFEKQQLCSVYRKRKIGSPDMSQATTCHMERANLTVRLFNRRHTRLTLGYSKKLANLKHSVALLTAHFNWCRVHSAHKTTPAQAAGLTDHAWTVEELLAAQV